MADLLIRDLSPEVLEVLDQRARAQGISRSEFVRRKLTQETASTQESCTEAHLKNLLTLLPDLADEKIMADAWR
jgi:hypothetical protein